MNEDLGKVRPERVKKTAHELVELYPDKFNTDFQNNKEVVESLVQISSSKLRNRIAGYITRLLSIRTEETEEAVEETNAEEDE